MPVTARRAPPLIHATLHVARSTLVWRVAGLRGASPNDRDGAHWRQRRRDRDRWLALLRTATRPPRLAWRTAIRAEITATEWGRGRDPDNAIASVKWLLDALVAERYLRDDGPDVVRRLSLVQPDARPSWLPNGPGVEIAVRRLA